MEQVERAVTGQGETPPAVHGSALAAQRPQIWLKNVKRLASPMRAR